MALTAALPWLYSIQLKGPAGVDMEPVWVFYLPQVYPAGVGTMPGRAMAAAEKPQCSCHKVATLDVFLQGLLEL